ncbi:MAG: hypothetical protein ABH829_03765 [archaeon]
MAFHSNWQEIAVLILILAFIPLAYLETVRLGSFYSDLKADAASTPEYRQFMEKYPSSRVSVLHPAPKGLWALGSLQSDAEFMSKYSSDQLLDFLLDLPVDKGELPSIWVVMVSPHESSRDGFIAPHPPAPVLFIAYDASMSEISSEVYA